MQPPVAESPTESPAAPAPTPAGAPAPAPAPPASELEAREVAEAAREEEWRHHGFARDLFDGRLRLDVIDPYPEPDPQEVERARPFMEKLEAILKTVDGDEIDRTGKLPAELVDSLKKIGAFGIKIPVEYGGLGLSQHSYTQAMRLVSGVEG